MNALEIAGFVTGALSVWLAVRQNPWNWPIGVAKAVCFLVLCWQSHLYGDMGLQVLFIALCLLGWYRWLYGGTGHSRLRVIHISPAEAIVYACLGGLCDRDLCAVPA
jgi:nicotinamide mononucleotide transporter